MSGLRSWVRQFVSLVIANDQPLATRAVASHVGREQSIATDTQSISEMVDLLDHLSSPNRRIEGA